MVRFMNPIHRFRSAWLKKRLFITLFILILVILLDVILTTAVYADIEGSTNPTILLISAITATICFTIGILGSGRLRDAQAQDFPGLSRLLRQHLLNVQDWDEFVERLLRFPKAVVPLEGASLHICYPAYGTCVLVKEFGLSQEILTNFPDFSDLCSYDILTQPHPLGFFIPDPDPESRSPRKPASICFALPFIFADRNVGVLSLYFSANTVLSPSQIAALNDLTPDIQIYLERAYLKRLLISSSEAVQKEQIRIAGYLHDTVAQDLALLQHYLDQLTQDEAAKAQTEMLAKLENVHDIAEQAEHHIRSSMADLRKEPAPQFDTALAKLVDDLRRRGQFSIDMTSDGEPQNLPAHLQRKVFYILREGLRNIEKHANASQVTIHSVWNPGFLTIEILDDGDGFVSESALRLKGHFGLRIMQETARDLNSQLSLTSTPGVGTQLSLSLPLPNPSWRVEPFDALLYR